LALRFNPIEFDADKWVPIAADAGQEYLTITSRCTRRGETDIGHVLDGAALARSSPSARPIPVTPLSASQSPSATRV
jgi:hypothetical protein